MKYLKIYEMYASERAERRRYDEWSKLSDKEKYEKFDAKFQFDKITKCCL